MTEWSQKQTTLAMRVAELQRENEKLHEALRLECELNATPVGIIKDRARMEERAAIIAWLHEQWVTDATDNIDVFDMIDGIKAGEHLK